MKWLNEERLINPKHHIVNGALEDYKFALENSSKLQDYGVNDNPAIEFDIKAKTICIINLFDESTLTLSFSEWLYYLEEGKKIYLENHPEDEEQINKWLEDYKKLTNLD
ncbi:MAG: hypothetical protein MJ245_05395 [Clostridia bacterium]|nr:hypothetical protein [Clostridia bacterium]